MTEPGRCTGESTLDGWRYVCVDLIGHQDEHTWKLAVIQHPYELSAPGAAATAPGADATSPLHPEAR